MYQDHWWLEKIDQETTNTEIGLLANSSNFNSKLFKWTQWLGCEQSGE